MYAQLPKNILLAIILLLFGVKLPVVALIAFWIELGFIMIIASYRRFLSEKIIDQGSVMFEIIAPNFSSQEKQFAYQEVFSRMGFRAFGLYLIYTMINIPLGICIIITTMVFYE